MEQAASASHFIAIGASGGEGLDDIQELLRLLPRLGMAVVMVVLHRPSNEPSLLREILGRHSAMPVVVATEAEPFKPGICYLGEPSRHLTLTAGSRAHLVPGEGDRLRNKTVDILFNSVAAFAGQHAVGVILSGALADGSRGLAAIHAAGGATMVLEPGGKVRGMQQNAIDYDGPVDVIGTAADIARAITRLIA